jgi:hypothetical protein
MYSIVALIAALDTATWVDHNYLAAAIGSAGASAG